MRPFLLRRHLRSLLALAAFLLLPQAAWAGSYDPGDGRLPIWWSDSLELESLDQVEERLSEPFEAGAIVLEESLGTNLAEGRVRDCFDLLSLSANLQEIEFLRSEAQSASLHIYRQTCQALAYARQAESAISGPVVNDLGAAIESGKLLLLLPAISQVALSRSQLCDLWQEGAFSHSWSSWGRQEERTLRPLGLEVGEVSRRVDFSLPVAGEPAQPADRYLFEPLLLADITADQEQDLLYRMVFTPSGGSGVFAELFLAKNITLSTPWRVTNSEEVFASWRSRPDQSIEEICF